ncbi:MAG TPA: hypothetical protein VKU40_08920, partial [Thermoanaerobaculia bacterium]|nr:hypothetical protein [Thermoanaerobaculia bacterium]
MPRRPLPLLLLLLASTFALATSPTAAEPGHETATEPTAGVEAWSFLIGRWETTAQRFSAAGEVIEENRGSAEF